MQCITSSDLKNNVTIYTSKQIPYVINSFVVCYLWRYILRNSVVNGTIFVGPIKIKY